MIGPYSVRPGKPRPLGARPDELGVNFSVFSRNATSVDLLLFDADDEVHPVQVVHLDPAHHRTFHFWHAYVEGLRPGARYAYRVDGPRDRRKGHRFNPSKVLIDPYALGISTKLWVRSEACHKGDNLRTSMRGVVIDPNHYDWEGDTPLHTNPTDAVIYEMHVGGFTRSPSSGVKHPGTFAGIIEKIPYLIDLGVTAVELMPIMQFDDQEVHGLTREGHPLTDYWGYNPVGFFVPHSGYCVSPDVTTHIHEFRDLVKALHKAGISVILDVVFNHTSEGNHLGPTYSFRGFDNSIFYHLEDEDRRFYKNYSGCGNTLNCNHPIVDKFILECLEFWVREMHVDGFRFDQGSILARGQEGAPLVHPPVIWHIELSEVLAETRIIAEAWDAAGLYQIGYFPGWRWAEWNGRYRDCIRRFIKGDPGLVIQVANSIAGSPDLYKTDGRYPANSINFVACHDGFTLNDLVSYNRKHNESNGEHNRDGLDENDSWNCGEEGPSSDPEIEALRLRQIKNFLTVLMVSQGSPMVLMGDEARRSQNGNNNAYCHDSELTWLDWRLIDQNHGVFRFYKQLMAFRKANRCLRRRHFFDGALNPRGLPEVSWHGCSLNEAGWDDPNARSLAFTLAGVEEDPDLHVMLNMYWEPLEFEIPGVIGRRWTRAIDTSLPAPLDISDFGSEPGHRPAVYAVGPRSVVVLASR